MAASHHNRENGLVPFGIVPFTVGALNAAKPGWQHRIRRWHYKNEEAPEPSDAALRLERIIGLLVPVPIVKLS